MLRPDHACRAQMDADKHDIALSDRALQHGTANNQGECRCTPMDGMRNTFGSGGELGVDPADECFCRGGAAAAPVGRTGAVMVTTLSLPAVPISRLPPDPDSCVAQHCRVGEQQTLRIITQICSITQIQVPIIVAWGSWGEGGWAMRGIGLRHPGGRSRPTRGTVQKAANTCWCRGDSLPTGGTSPLK